MDILFAVVYYFLTILWATVTLLRTALVICTNPVKAFKKTRRDVPPSCLLDASLGTHKYVTANGLKFHYVSAGDESKPLMLFLHGFPEFWFSWRYQLQEFSKDYHVVAIDMRGYNETSKPPHRSDYSFENLRQDIVELVPALGHRSCILVGHDWGGIVGWRVTQRHPELVERFIVMNCPHAKVFKNQILSRRSQLLKSWYLFMFQVPWLPEFVFGLKDYAFFNAMFRGKNAGVRNKETFPPEVVEAYKYVFSKPGAMTGPINYIRCMFDQHKGAGGNPKPIQVPILILWGDDDLFLDKELCDQHSLVASNVTTRHIPNCSHWVQQDAYPLVNKHMREFLDESG
eukprot:Em0011g959a